MKKRIFTILASVLLLAATTLISPISASAQKIKWMTLEEALKLTKKDPKPILVDLYTDWCGYCKKLDAVTFTNKHIVNYINKTFYAVKFNAEQRDPITYKDSTYTNPGRTHSLASVLAYGRLSFPTLVYLDSNGDQITAVPGYMEPRALEPILHYIGEGAYKEEDFKAFQKEFKGNF